MNVKRETYQLETYLNNVKDRDIRPDAETQRKYKKRSNEWRDGLVRTIFQRKFSYIPEIQLSEEYSNGKKVRYILNGLHRTMTLLEMMDGTHKISKSMKNSIVTYLKKRVDENGNYVLDQNGDFYFDETEFDLRGKSFKDFPLEMQKTFKEYQISTIIFEDCTKEEQAEWVIILNEQNAMNASQKAFTHINHFAKKIRSITDNSRFFKDCGKYTPNERENGTLERIVTESVMSGFHLDEWKKETDRMGIHVNEYSTENEFDVLNDYFDRLVPLCEGKYKSIFNSKNTFLFIAAFDRFTRFGMDDCKFAEFLDKFEEELHSKVLKDEDENDISWDILNENRATKDKTVVIGKIEFLEKLMMDYFGIGKEDIEVKSDEEFIADMVDMEVEEVAEVLELCNETLDNLLTMSVIDGDKITDLENRPSLLAVVMYGIDNVKQNELEEWFVEYVNKNPVYIRNQKQNYLHMRNSLSNYLTANAVQYIKERKEEKKSVPVQIRNYF